MSTLRNKIIRLAHSMPSGSEERKALLEVLAPRTASGMTPEHREKMLADQKKALALARKVKDRDLKAAITDAIKGAGGQFAEIGKWSVEFRTGTKYLPDAKYEIKVDITSSPKDLIKEKGKSFSSFQDAAAYMKKIGEQALKAG